MSRTNIAALWRWSLGLALSEPLRSWCGEALQNTMNCFIDENYKKIVQSNGMKQNEKRQLKERKRNKNTFFNQPDSRCSRLNQRDLMVMALVFYSAGRSLCWLLLLPFSSPVVSGHASNPPPLRLAASNQGNIIKYKTPKKDNASSRLGTMGTKKKIVSGVKSLATIAGGEQKTCRWLNTLNESGLKFNEILHWSASWKRRLSAAKSPESPENSPENSVSYNPTLRQPLKDYLCRMSVITRTMSALNCHLHDGITVFNRMQIKHCRLVCRLLQLQQAFRKSMAQSSTPDDDQSVSWTDERLLIVNWLKQRCV